MAKTRIDLAEIKNQLAAMNDLLESGIPQEQKAKICTAVESLLCSVDCYSGFNYLYWLREGFEKWQDSGEPDFPEKLRFIVGDGSEPHHGEYSRVYFSANLSRKIRQEEKLEELRAKNG